MESRNEAVDRVREHGHHRRACFGRTRRGHLARCRARRFGGCGRRAPAASTPPRARSRAERSTVRTAALVATARATSLRHELRVSVVHGGDVKVEVSPRVTRCERATPEVVGNRSVGATLRWRASGKGRCAAQRLSRSSERAKKQRMRHKEANWASSGGRAWPKVQLRDIPPALGTWSNVMCTRLRAPSSTQSTQQPSRAGQEK